MNRTTTAALWLGVIVALAMLATLAALAATNGGFSWDGSHPTAGFSDGNGRAAA